MPTDPTALPPERLGALLRHARRNAGLSRRRAAHYASLSVAELIAIEKGWESPSRQLIDCLVACYGITVETLIPARRPLTVNATTIATGVTGDVVIAATSARDDILRSYIGLITNARNEGRLDALRLRESDIEALSAALDTDESVLATRIAELIGCTDSEAAALGRLLRTFAGPLIGIAFSVAVVGGSVVAGNTSGVGLAPSTHRAIISNSADAPIIEVGNAIPSHVQAP